MVFLPGLAVVFVGITGGGAGRVDKQVQSVLHDAHVQRASLPAAALHTLTHHGEGCRDIVRKLHVSGVVGGELVTSDAHVVLRLVIYDGDGGLKSLSEIPLSGRALSNDELSVLRSNFEDEVGGLAPAADEPAAPAEPIAPPPKVVKAPPQAKVAPKPAADEIALDDESPLEPASGKQKPAPATHKAEPVETADASDSVSIDDITAMTSGEGGETGGGSVTETASAPSDGSLHLRASVGLGFAARSFAPGPSTVPGYASAAVGVVHFNAQVQPTARTTLGVVAERTLQMNTPLADGMAPTAISRWEVTGRYALTRGRVEIAPQLGLGHRSFSIDSTDPSRSPDGDYSYVMIGARASAGIGHGLTLQGVFTLEPVISGVEPTEMAFGEASRWALDVGAALEARPWAHVFVRAAADYQRFAWSWDAAGARGAGGAVDAYPSGTLSLGANY